MTRHTLLTLALSGCLMSAGAAADEPCGIPPPDGGPGTNCHPFKQYQQLRWGRGTQVDSLDGVGSGYLEAPLQQIAPGEVIELRLGMTLNDVRRVTTADQHAFVELDLDRDDRYDLLPLRLVLQKQADGATVLHLDGPKVHLQSAPAQEGAHDVRLHWLQLDSQHGEVSLLVNGEVLGTNVLRGTPVALRLGDLDAQADGALRGHVQFDARSLDWQR